MSDRTASQIQLAEQDQQGPKNHQKSWQGIQLRVPSILILTRAKKEERKRLAVTVICTTSSRCGIGKAQLECALPTPKKRERDLQQQERVTWRRGACLEHRFYCPGCIHSLAWLALLGSGPITLCAYCLLAPAFILPLPIIPFYSAPSSQTSQCRILWAQSTPALPVSGSWCLTNMPRC